MDEQEIVSRYKWISRYEKLKDDATKSSCSVCTFTREQYMKKFNVSREIASRDIRFMLTSSLIEEPKRKKGKFRIIL